MMWTILILPNTLATWRGVIVEKLKVGYSPAPPLAEMASPAGAANG
jgi:hypothetical protein